MTKPHPIVIFGGETRESLVSTATAQNLAQNLDSPTIWFWGKDGKVSETSVQDLLDHKDPFKQEYELRDAIQQWGSLPIALDSRPPRNDRAVVILALHGGMGENGTVQKWMEERNTPFIGSGSEASALAFNKTRAKKAIQSAGMLVPKSLDSIHSIEDIRQFFKLHGPSIIKPNEDGSSFGLAFIRTEEDLSSCITRGTIAEQIIEGTELTVPVVELDGELRALPVIEIRKEPGREFDYAGKYAADGVAEICPAEIPEALAKAAQKTAIDSHMALGCRGYSRTDVIAAKDGIYFLELNTLPGLTKESLVPKSLKVAGIGMGEFLAAQSSRRS